MDSGESLSDPRWRSESVCLFSYNLHIDGGLVAKSCPKLATPWTVAHQAPLSLGFSRQEYWSRLPFSSPGDLPNLGVGPRSPTLAGKFFTFWTTREALICTLRYSIIRIAWDTILTSSSSIFLDTAGQVLLHVDVLLSFWTQRKTKVNYP